MKSIMLTLLDLLRIIEFTENLVSHEACIGFFKNDENV